MPAITHRFLLRHIPGDYKVIFVGDAQMSPHELMGTLSIRREDGPQCGLDWLKLLREQYRHAIWLNPGDRPEWGGDWADSYDAISEVFPMFPLTVDGLEAGMKKLLVR